MPVLVIGMKTHFGGHHKPLGLGFEVWNSCKDCKIPPGVRIWLCLLWWSGGIDLFFGRPSPEFLHFLIQTRAGNR